MSDFFMQGVPSTNLTDTYEAASVDDVRGHDRDMGFNPQLNASTAAMSDIFKQGVPSTNLTDTYEAASVDDVRGHDRDAGFNPQLNASSTAEKLRTTHLVKIPVPETPHDSTQGTMETRSGEPTTERQDIE